jgi:hypothetical protein
VWQADGRRRSRPEARPNALARPGGWQGGPGRPGGVRRGQGRRAQGHRGQVEARSGAGGEARAGGRRRKKVEKTAYSWALYLDAILKFGFTGTDLRERKLQCIMFMDTCKRVFTVALLRALLEMLLACNNSLLCC